MSNKTPPIEFNASEVQFYVDNTNVSALHRALLLAGNPRLEFKHMKKRDFIISLMLLRHALFKLGFQILPIFLMCNIEATDLIEENHELSVEEILIKELASPIRLIYYERNQTKTTGDLYNENQREILLDEIEMFTLIMNQ